MSQVRKWCYYSENTPYAINLFDPPMVKVIEQEFMKFMTTKANGACINGATFDFDNMVCMCKGVTYKLSPTNGYVPYKVIIGGDCEGLNTNDRTFFNKIDPGLVCHRWLFWDNPQQENPFVSFSKDGGIKPKWRFYSPEDEKEIEQLFKTNSNSTEPFQFNSIFCARFNSMYNGSKVMIAGRCNDENNLSLAENSKRRRPIARASFCWCWDNSNGKGESNWVPYSMDISASLEEAFLSNKPEIDISVGAEKYTVNFTQGIQFKIEFTFKKWKIKRFGTEICDYFMNDLGCGYAELEEVLPPYWDPQDKSFLFSTHLNISEVRTLNKLIDSYLPGIIY